MTDFFLDAMRGIVGRRHVLTGAAAAPYTRGFRFGGGSCLAVVRPASLVEQWRVLQACVTADKIVIMQAANTGLTGGSTPDIGGYDSEVVIVSTTRMGGVQLIEEGRQVICLPGATLYELERVLKPLGREPHSVIGSSCLGASVIGGVCNNSGGALVRRGPAYTELALFAQQRGDGRLELVNHLGMRLGDDPEQILARLDRADYSPMDIEPLGGRRAADGDYARHVRDVDAPTPARYNADPRRLFEASGCAGRLAVFAVRLETFEQEVGTRVFYIGTNDPADLTNIRRKVLMGIDSLPIAAEYIHRDAFDIAEVYGKDLYLAIRRMGTDRLPILFRWKNKLDRLGERVPFLPRQLSDRVMQALSRLFPSHLPPRIRQARDRFEHHLLLRMPEDALETTRSLLADALPARTGGYFECTPQEAEAAFLHRFVTAGAAVRYRTVHPGAVSDIVALDIALRRNDTDWLETLPAELEACVLHKLYYGHFFCHVFHQDYVLKKGVDPLAFEHKLWALLDERGAEYPAEHNVGHLYHAKPALAEFYDSLDPCARFNPGIGQPTGAAAFNS